MIDNNPIMLQENALIANTEVVSNEVKPSKVILSPYLDTRDAAKYLHKSVSWMLRQKDIIYYRGKPNLYLPNDLDNWMTLKRRHDPVDKRIYGGKKKRI